jgi:hypothetical protein
VIRRAALSESPRLLLHLTRLQGDVLVLSVGSDFDAKNADFARNFRK